MAHRSKHNDFYADALAVLHNTAHRKKGNRKQEVDFCGICGPGIVRSGFMLCGNVDCKDICVHYGTSDTLGKLRTPNILGVRKNFICFAALLSYPATLCSL